MTNTKLHDLFSTGSITLTDDAAALQSAQVRFDNRQLQSDVPTLTLFGVSSRPLPGATALVCNFGGDKRNPLIIGTHDDRTRPRNLAPGETIIYNAAGMSVLISNAGIVINGGGANITINGAPQVVVNGGDVIADGISLKTHRHSGIQPGSGQTGVPV